MNVRTCLHGAATGLSLLATPTFAAMAVLAAFSPGAAGGICGSGAALPGATGEMVWMYGLMSLFHLPSWVRLLAPSRRICHSRETAPGS